MYYVYIAAAALFWGVSPLIGRISGIGPHGMAIAVGFGTAFATIPLFFLKGVTEDLFSKGGLIATGSGVLNGIGLVGFYLLVAGSVAGKWQLSTPLTMIYATIPVVVAVGAWMLFNEQLTVNKAAALGLIAVAIFLLNK